MNPRRLTSRTFPFASFKMVLPPVHTQRFLLRVMMWWHFRPKTIRWILNLIMVYCYTFLLKSTVRPRISLPSSFATAGYSVPFEPQSKVLWGSFQSETNDTSVFDTMSFSLKKGAMRLASACVWNIILGNGLSSTHAYGWKSIHIPFHVSFFVFWLCACNDLKITISNTHGKK